jgi:hypothetical protein
VRGGVEFGVGNGPVDETPLGGGGGADEVAGEGHLEGPLAADVAGHGDERGVAEQPTLAAGEGEAGALGSDREIAAGH